MAQWVKGARHRAWRPKFGYWDPKSGWREQTLFSDCHTHATTHMHLTCNIQKKKTKLLKSFLAKYDLTLAILNGALAYPVHRASCSFTAFNLGSLGPLVAEILGLRLLVFLGSFTGNRM